LDSKGGIAGEKPGGQCWHEHRPEIIWMASKLKRPGASNNYLSCGHIP